MQLLLVVICVKILNAKNIIYGGKAMYKFLGLLGEIGALFLWAFSFIKLAMKKPLAIILMLIIHVSETLTIGPKVGKEFGETKAMSIVYSMLYGFTWWLPLKIQMKEETLTSQDFVRTSNDVEIPDRGI